VTWPYYPPLKWTLDLNNLEQTAWERSPSPIIRMFGWAAMVVLAWFAADSLGALVVSGDTLALVGEVDRMLAAIKAASQVLETLKREGTIAGLAPQLPSFKEFFDLVGMDEVQEMEARYGVEESARAKY